MHWRCFTPRNTARTRVFGNFFLKSSEGLHQILRRRKEHTAPQGIGHRHLPIVPRKHRQIRKIIDAIDADAIQERLFIRCGFQQKIRQTQIDNHRGKKAEGDVLPTLNVAHHGTKEDSTRSQPEEIN